MVSYWDSYGWLNQQTLGISWESHGNIMEYVNEYARSSHPLRNSYSWEYKSI
jgi:hypothetical protein